MTSTPADPSPDTTSEIPPERQASWKEIALVFGLSLFLTRIFSDLASISSLVNEHLFTLVCATFLVLPYIALHRRNADFDAHALTPHPILRSTALALGLAVLTAIPFFAGYHLWQTKALGRSFSFSSQNYYHLPVSLQGRPSNLMQLEPKPQVLLWTDGPNIHARIHAGPHAGAPPTPVALELSTQEGTVHVHTGRAMAVQRDVRRSGSPSPKVTLRNASHTARFATFRVHDADDLQVRVLVANQPATHTALRLGPGRLPPDALDSFSPKTATLSLPRSVSWVALIILVQLLLIAFPEETFYRAYLQTSIDRLHPKRFQLPFSLHLSPAILITSAAFALGHFVINLQPGRLAVFFPSLLFGWLRDKTGTLTSCIVYHAACNLLVETASQHYI